MFNRHQKAIGSYARMNPENMKRVYWFVIATVQQSLVDVPEILKSFEEEGEASKYMFAWKSDAFRYARDNAEDIYTDAIALWNTARDDAEAADWLLAYFAGLPGLGLAKGGFMVQLCFGLSGCLDSHNVARFGLNKNTFSAARFKGAKTKKTRTKLVKMYHELVAKAGGCEALWNDWCDYVAERQPANYEDGNHVSRVHVEALGVAA